MRRERALVDQWLTGRLSELNPPWGYAVYALMRKNPAYPRRGAHRRFGRQVDREDGDARRRSSSAPAPTSAAAASARRHRDRALGASLVHRRRSSSRALPAVSPLLRAACRRGRPAQAWLGDGNALEEMRSPPGGAGRALKLVEAGDCSAFAVVLDPGRAQPGKAVLVDGGLPVEEFVDAQRIAVAGLFEAQAARRERRQQLRPCGGSPSAACSWAAGPRSSADFHPGRSRTLRADAFARSFYSLTQPDHGRASPTRLKLG